MPKGKTAGTKRGGKKRAVVKKVDKKRKIKKRKSSSKKPSVPKAKEERGEDGLTAWERAAEAVMQGHVDPETKKRARVRALLTEALVEWLVGRESMEDEEEELEQEEEEETGPRAVLRRKVLEVEEALLVKYGAQHGGNGTASTAYIEKAKSLKFNLKTNKELRDALLDPSLKYNGKTLTADTLLAMNSADLARSEKKEERKVNQEEDLFNRNLSKLDHMPQSKRELHQLPPPASRND